VINFITRNDFSGMELSVSDRITQRGDGNYLRGDLTLGANFDDGRGNAVLSVGYQESDPVFQGGVERAWSNLAVDSIDPGVLALAGSSTTVPARFDVPGGNLQVDPAGTGTLVPYFLPFNFTPYNVFQTPFQRYNLFAAGHYDITDHLTVYARGLFSHNSVKTIVAPSGVFASTVEIPISNPFLTNAQAATLCSRIDTDPATTGIQAPTNCAAARLATDPDSADFRTIELGLRRRTTELGPHLGLPRRHPRRHHRLDRFRRIRIARYHRQRSACLGLRLAIACSRCLDGDQYDNVPQWQRRVRSPQRLWS
jgi:hypothetical protein